MKKLYYRQSTLAFLCLLLFHLTFQGSKAKAQTTADYVWKQAAIGGGGFVTGIITHPTSGDIYCRTDVGGAYRWDAANSKWIQLLDWISDDEKGFSGVESLALDPQDPDNVYILAGIDYYDNGRTAILKSTDKGSTFTYTDVTSQFKAHGNGIGRSKGERLAVDPNNSNILFCGTRANGLWKSTDGGVTWNGVTTTVNGSGICFVVFDPLSGVVSGATQTIYIGVSRTGSANIYKSTDGGETFTAVSANTGFMPHRATLQGTTMYVTHSDVGGPSNISGTGRLYKLNTSTGVWTDVTPNGNNYSYGGISIDPSDVNRVVTSTINMFNNNQYGAEWGDFIYLSTDGGASWTLKNGINSKLNKNGIGWTGGQIHWAGCIEFTPGNTAEVRVISGNGVFTCSDIEAADPVWKYDVIGLEEAGPTDGVSLPGGRVVSTFWDLDGFVHDDLTAFPAQRLQPSVGHNWSIDYAASDPDKLIRTSDAGASVYYSTDAGDTWTASATVSGSGGRAAISADGGTMLHCPDGSSTTYYSTNDGGSWASVSGVTITNAIPVSDRVNSNYFYVHDPWGGDMLVSSDKGVSFSAAGTPGGTTTPWTNTYIRTVPGYEGHLWVPLIDNGLKYSTDHGATYTTVLNVTYCRAVGIGKANVSATYPTVFIWGTVGGVRGLFRSTDQGANWTRIDDDAHEFGGITIVFGDVNVFGRVYMSSHSGRGLIYWEPAACTATTITPYVQINEGSWEQTASVTLNAGDTVKFGPQPTTGGSWSWSGPNGFTATTGEVAIYNVEANQAGIYVATYTNSEGCESTQAFSVTVTTDSGSVVTGFTESENILNDVVIYPNPNNNGKFNISLPEIVENSVVNIFDSKGRLVYQKYTDGNKKLELDQRLNAGVYLIKVSSNKLDITKKLIVD